MSLEKSITENVTVCSICCNALQLGPAIAAVVIGFQYDENSPCNIRSTADLTLKWFLITAGLIQIGWTFFLCIASLIAAICCSDLSRRKYGEWIFEMFTCPPLSFTFIWAIIGLYIYDQNLNDQCQNEAIGQILLGWSIIQIIFAAPALCIMCTHIFKYRSDY